MMPKTGYHMPNQTDSPEYILEYIRYKEIKMRKLMKQSKKLLSHVIKAKKILDTIVERNGE